MSHIAVSRLGPHAFLPGGLRRIHTARAGVLASLLALSALLALLTGCGISPISRASGGKLQVVAAENVWGSIVAQLGGDHVQVTSIIVNPNTDPHDYDATPADARVVASANYVILNGAGYDAWGQQLLDANLVSGRVELDIGKLLGKHNGDNPHFWYNPDAVTRVARQITADLKHLDAADASYFDQQNQQFLTTDLKTYHDLIDTLKQNYQDTPVGATENIFEYQASALGLNLISPPGFMKSVSEGDEPTAEDKAAFDQQVTKKLIKVFIYNQQNATPDTDALKAKAQQEGIPIVAITETLDPATDSFQVWQSAQLQALEQALAQPTGRR